MPAEPSTSTSQQTQKLTLIEGTLMRCPNCELLRNPLDHKQFKRMDLKEKYAQHLNVVYMCVKTRDSWGVVIEGEGCGHVFSPGDQQILMAFLAGDLVPAQRKPQNKGGK